MAGYVYKFLDSKGNVLYVGMTMRELSKRMHEHFGTDGHLPQSCYDRVNKIMYQTFKEKDDVEKMEKFYIAYYYPEYNIKDKPSKKLNVHLPKRFENWKQYENDVILNKNYNAGESGIIPEWLYNTLMAGIIGGTAWKLLLLLL